MKALLCKLFGWFCVASPVVEAPKPNPVPDVVVISDPSQMKKEIEEIVDKSKCKDFWFNDYDGEKQKAPTSFIKGLALSAAQSKCKNKWQDLPTKYASILGLANWECSFSCCGIDRSSGRPNKVSSESAEAGEWQSSYDLKYQAPSFPSFMKEWRGECFSEYFKPCTGKEAENFGSGDGLEFQKKAKSCPSFGAETVLMNWDFRKSHYWPFKNNKVQAPQECVDMFKTVLEIVECK